MTEEQRIDQTNRILEIRSSGAIQPSDVKASLKKMLQAKEDSGINKILIDATDVNRVPGTSDTFHMMSDVPRGLRIAIIVQGEQPVLDDIVFGELVANNRGGNVRRFVDKASAIRWLQGEAQASS